MQDNSEVYQRFIEDIHEGMRLGRNLWLDPRSLAYAVERNAEAMSSRLANQHWERVIPILNQGSLGSCVGNASTGALGTRPFYDTAGKTALGVLYSDAQADEKYAVQLYSDATKVDPYAGAWPPTDTGTSALAACKVLRSRGTISGYRWATSPVGFLTLLQTGPVLMGTPWYNAFFDPNRNGFIDSSRNWRSSGIAGGHEIEAIGVDINASDLYASVITFANSWGTGWGDHGYFRMKLNTYTQLNQVDLKQFVV